MGVGIGRHPFVNAHKLLLGVLGNQVGSRHGVQVHPLGPEEFVGGDFHLLRLHERKGVLNGLVVVADFTDNVARLVPRTNVTVSGFSHVRPLGHGQLTDQLNRKIPIPLAAHFLTKPHHSRLAGPAPQGQLLHRKPHHTVQVVRDIPGDLPL